MDLLLLQFGYTLNQGYDCAQAPWGDIKISRNLSPRTSRLVNFWELLNSIPILRAKIRRTPKKCNRYYCFRQKDAEKTVFYHRN